MIERVILAGGGTGGHLFPGLAVIDELRRRRPTVEVLFVGTERGIEARVLPNMGERLELLNVSPLKGQSLGNLMRSLVRMPKALSEARKILDEFKPDLVIGVGGYASGPMLLAASRAKIPTAILEQNAHVGLTNRLLAKRVGRAYLSFEETAAHFRDEAVRVVGNPVRKEIVSAARLARIDPLGFEARADQIFILGGSQGARALNEFLPEVLRELDLEAMGLRVLHQTGESMRDAVEARYEALGVPARVEAFISDMAGAYASSKLVIARAGASTVAELAALGRPAIFIPFPFAADDHQTRNAEALERAGAALCIQERDLDRDAMVRIIRQLLGDEERLRAMGEASRSVGKPEAAAEIVDDLMAWLEGAPEKGGNHGSPQGVINGEQNGGADEEKPPLGVIENQSVSAFDEEPLATCSLERHAALRSADAYRPRTRTPHPKPLVLDGSEWNFGAKSNWLC